MALIGAMQAGAAIVVATSVAGLFGAVAHGGTLAAGPAAALMAAILLASWLRYRERLDGERLGQAVWRLFYHQRRKLHA